MDPHVVFHHEGPEMHAFFAGDHFARFASDPKDFWALSTALDCIRSRGLQEQIDEDTANALAQAVEDAWWTAHHEVPHLAGSLDGFPAVLKLVWAWSTPEDMPRPDGAAIFDTRHDPGLRDARDQARVLQNAAHNLSIKQAMARRQQSRAEIIPFPA